MKTFIQISAGYGPIECARVVYHVANKIADELSKCKLRILEYEEHVHDLLICYRSITFYTDDILPADFKTKWEGTIKWIATSNPFRPNHKRKNWFIGVNLFDELILPELNDSDIKYESCRASGPGGQHVNTSDSAIWATHIPTGIKVRCESERSQIQNKKIAKVLLQKKFAEQNQQLIEDNNHKQWLSKIQIDRGNPVQTFKGDL